MPFSARTVASQSVLLSVVLFNGITLLLSAGGSLFGTLEGFAHSYVYPFFVYPALATLLICGIVIMLATRWGIIANESTRRRLALVFAIIGAACYVGMIAASQPVAIACAVVTGISCAISYLMQLMTWGARLSRTGIKQSLLTVSAASAIAGVMALVLFAFSSSFVMAAGYCATLVGGGITAAATKQLEEPDQNLDATPMSARRSFRLKPEFWTLFAGSLLCVFTLLLMWTGPDAGQTHPHSDLLTQGEFVGFIGCVIALAAISAMHPDEGTLKRNLIRLCPLFAVFPIVPCVVTGEPTFPFGAIMGIVTGIGFAYFIVVPMAVFCAESGLDKNVQGIWGTGAIAIAIGGIAGVTCATIADGSFTTPVTLCLFIAYLVACALMAPAQATSLQQASGGPRASREPDAGASSASQQVDVLSPQDSFDAHCAQLAEQWGLTPREREILPLLARGRTQPSIARELCCSPETVKVHVRHIHEKSGIRSKDELLELVHATWQH
jgi:DNA-binding CsgD family transcriptional regulator